MFGSSMYHDDESSLAGFYTPTSTTHKVGNSTSCLLSPSPTRSGLHACQQRAWTCGLCSTNNISDFNRCCECDCVNPSILNLSQDRPHPSSLSPIVRHKRTGDEGGVKSIVTIPSSSRSTGFDENTVLRSLLGRCLGCEIRSSEELESIRKRVDSHCLSRDSDSGSETDVSGSTALEELRFENASLKRQLGDQKSKSQLREADIKELEETISELEVKISHDEEKKALSVQWEERLAVMNNNLQTVTAENMGLKEKCEALELAMVDLEVALCDFTTRSE